MSSTIVDIDNEPESLAIAGLSLAMFVIATGVFVSRIFRHKGYTTPLYLLVLFSLVRITEFSVEIPAILRANEDKLNSKALITTAVVLDAFGIGLIFMKTLLSLRSWVVKVRMGTIHPAATQHNPKTSYFLIFCSIIALLNGILSMIAIGLSISNSYDSNWTYYSPVVAFVNASIYVVLAVYLTLTVAYLISFAVVYTSYVLPKSDLRYFWILTASGSLLGLRMVYSFTYIFAAYYDSILLHFFLATVPEVLLLALLGAFSRTFAQIVTNPSSSIAEKLEPTSEV